MSLSRFLVLCSLLAVLFPTLVLAENYNYISATALETRLTAKEPTHLVDIQVEEEYSQHHIKGALATYAYPVKSDADKAKIAALLEKLKADSNPIVVICPRGAGGATRTYDYLLTQGIAPERLLILEKGQAGWNCPSLSEGK